ncbi:MAG TPA: RDD family protein [Methanocella sp.]|nr:RDD family protein [Methanocella sp.]
MDISDEAKARLTNRVSRIVGDIDVYEAEKNDITRELTSHFYDHAMTHAQARGSNVIERPDIEAVFAESEDPKEIAAGYMQSYVSSLRRAGFWPRFFANVIDSLILGLIFVLGFTMIFLPFLAFFPDQFNLNFWEPHYSFFNYPNGPVAVLFALVTGVPAFVAVLVYFIVFEGQFGATPGKWLLGMQVLRENGTRVGYTEAIIRNIPKVVGNSVFLVIDALLMLLVFGKEKQRGFDKIARTIVVHKAKKEGA